VDGAKLELQEVVDFLKNPDKYTALGAKIPKVCSTPLSNFGLSQHMLYLLGQQVSRGYPCEQVLSWDVAGLLVGGSTWYG
jgi:hypothetical protein